MSTRNIGIARNIAALSTLRTSTYCQYAVIAHPGENHYPTDT